MSEIIDTVMMKEILTATDFLIGMMKVNKSSSLTEEQLSRYHSLVVDCLQKQYTDHWHPEHPVKGSGYRCIRINGKVDPVLLKAGNLMGLANKYLHTILPSDLTMWVDPHEVCYRFGENGSICILYEDKSVKFRSPPSPPTTPPSKKIRSSPEPPATPIKLQNTHLFQCQQITPPHNYHQQVISPSNNRRQASPPHYSFLQQHHHLALLKENCKDSMRPNHVLPFSEGLYVSS